jgi:hypothetical protein
LLCDSYGNLLKKLRELVRRTRKAEDSNQRKKFEFAAPRAYNSLLQKCIRGSSYQKARASMSSDKSGDNSIQSDSVELPCISVRVPSSTEARRAGRVPVSFNAGWVIRQSARPNGKSLIEKQMNESDSGRSDLIGIIKLMSVSLNNNA